MMHSNLFELPEVVVKSFSARAECSHVLLTLSDDAYIHSHSLTKQLSSSLNKPVYRIPQYITEYSVDEYLSSKENAIIHLPFIAQRSKQLLSRILRIVSASNQTLVIGAEYNYANELVSIANAVDVIVTSDDLVAGNIDDETISNLLDRIASSNVDKNVELLRRIGATQADIFSNIILGQLLIRGIDLRDQKASAHDESVSSAEEQNISSPIEEKMFDELSVVLSRFRQKENSAVKASAHANSRQGGAKQRHATHGRPNRALARNSRSGMFSLFNTLMTAAPHQVMRRLNRPKNDLAYLIEKEDIRRYPYESTPTHLEILILDSSGSMAGRERIRYAKGLVHSFVTRSYQRRWYCSLIVARSHEARVVVTPTRRVTPLLEELKRTPTGGRTPLFDSLTKAIAVAKAFKKKEPSATISISLLTDGKDNSDSSDTSELIRIMNKERFSPRVFDTSAASSSIAFAESIGATHHIIERDSVR